MAALRRRSARLRAVAVVLAAVMAAGVVSPTRAMPIVAPLSVASAEAVSLRVGVVVLAVGGEARETAWAVARAVYGDRTLRPRIGDLDAKVMIGEVGAPVAAVAASASASASA